MKQAWEKLALRFQARKPRERFMVFAAGAALIVLIVFEAAIDDTRQRQKAARLNIDRYQAEVAQLQKQNAEMSRLLAADPEVVERHRVDDLTRQLAAFDAELHGVQQTLVPPDKMARVLEELLKGESSVRLVRLRTLPAMALDAPEVAPVAAGVVPSGPRIGNPVFKHGIELTLEGGYLHLVAYQAKLEKLPWRMFFARTHIDSTAYPRATMTLTVYTLSLEKTWLVV
jgi:MSHA biogenesis protein MshJ